MLGPTVALSCAFSWAIAVILWRRSGSEVHPFALNVYKNALSFGLMIPTLLFVEHRLFIPINSDDFWMLVLSGTIGIGISDGLYLWSLDVIGASRLAIIDCLYSPVIIFLSWLFLSEHLFPIQLFGGALVLSAVFVVTHEGSPHSPTRHNLVKGSLVCLTSIVLMATGILFVKPLFDRVPLFYVITVRLGAGFFSSLLITLAMKNRRVVFRSLYHSKNKPAITVASFFGSYISMLLWVSGFKFNSASIAAVFNQMTTIFTILLAVIFLKEKMTMRKLVATGLALTGVLLVTLN